MFKVHIVEAAHLAHSEPSLSSAFKRCVDKGASKVVLMPYLLTHDDRKLDELRESLAQCASGYPQIGCSVSRSLGSLDRLLELVHRAVLVEAEALGNKGIVDIVPESAVLVNDEGSGASIGSPGPASGVPSKRKKLRGNSSSMSVLTYVP